MKRLLILSLILMALIGSASAVFNPADYTYYEDFYVNSTTAQTDYQVKMILSNETDYAVTGVWYTNGVTRDDWLDVAWTDTSNNLFPFWNETGSYTVTNSTWWINVSSIADDSTTEIRLHYGDADATESYADAAATFIFIDDFNTLSSTYWNTDNGAPSASASILTLQSAAGGAAEQKISSKTAWSVNDLTIIRARVKFQHWQGAMGEENWGVASAGWAKYITMDSSHRTASYRGTYTNWNGLVGHTAIIGLTADTFVVSELKRHDTSDWIVNDVNRVMLATNYPTDDLPIMFHAGYYNGQTTTYVDWVLVRKYAAVEPFLTHKPKAPIASFTLVLTDTSSGPTTSWQWNATNLLGDNIPVTISTDQNPILTLTQGNWLIDLIATNAAGSDTCNSTIGINLTSPQIYFWERTS